VDQVSNAFTLFSLLEGAAVPQEALGKELPVEAHIYWMVDVESREKTFDVRVVRRELSTGNEDIGGVLPLKTPAVERIRFRTGAFRLPRSYGAHVLHVEWRPTGTEEWTRDPALWPLEIVPAPHEENAE
jgi:hypothetical protein